MNNSHAVCDSDADDQVNPSADRVKRGVIKIDKILNRFDFDLLFKIDEINIEYIKEKVGKQKLRKLVDLGCEYQTYTLKKVDKDLTIKVCGWRVGVYDDATEIYQALMQSKTTMTKSIEVLLFKLKQQQEVKNLINAANHTFGVML